MAGRRRPFHLSIDRSKPDAGCRDAANFAEAGGDPFCGELSDAVEHVGQGRNRLVDAVRQCLLSAVNGPTRHKDDAAHACEPGCSIDDRGRSFDIDADDCLRRSFLLIEGRRERRSVDDVRRLRLYDEAIDVIANCNVEEGALDPVGEWGPIGRDRRRRNSAVGRDHLGLRE